MNSLSYYDRSQLPWNSVEADQLQKEYLVDSLNVIECANIHKRTPGCVAYKLRSLNVVYHVSLARGYMEYIKSPLYTEIVSRPKAAKKTKKSSTLRVIEDCTNKLSIIEEIEKMKSDINELKGDIKEVLRLMNAVYSFEEANA